jgi:hypothetical protein
VPTQRTALQEDIVKAVNEAMQTAVMAAARALDGLTPPPEIDALKAALKKKRSTTAAADGGDHFAAANRARSTTNAARSLAARSCAAEKAARTLRTSTPIAA